MNDTESLADNILEIASEQRLNILQLLQKTPSLLSEINKKLEITASETHRNLQRLLDSDIISKNSDGRYSPTTFGYLILNQLESIEFIIQNKEFWKKHSFFGLDDSFVKRIGDLDGCKKISGFVRVNECIYNIYQNSTKYIYNMLQEASYDSDIISCLKQRLSAGTAVHTIFSKNTIFPDKRETIKNEFSKFLKSNLMERRLAESFPINIIINEKEGCVCFSNIVGEINLNHAFYGNTKSFHRWCHDIFEEFWDKSEKFSENKIET